MARPFLILSPRFLSNAFSRTPNSSWETRNGSAKIPRTSLPATHPSEPHVLSALKAWRTSFFNWPFTEEESKLSSSHALKYKSGHFKDLPASKKTILWLTDSANMVTFLTKGSTKPAIQRVILEVFKDMRSLALNIVPVHISRNDMRIQDADAGTRFFDPDDWSLDAKTFQRIRGQKIVSLDVFAHISNSRAERFFPYGKCPQSSGTDAFIQSWETEHWAWVCPPTNLIVDAIKKICSTCMNAFLVVPCWKTAAFWPYLCPDGEHLLQQASRLRVCRPYVIRGKHCDYRLLQGYMAFPFLAVEIRSDDAGYITAAGVISVLKELAVLYKHALSTLPFVVGPCFPRQHPFYPSHY